MFFIINPPDTQVLIGGGDGEHIRCLLMNVVLAGEMTVVSSTATELSNSSFNTEPSLHSLIDFLFLSN